MAVRRILALFIAASLAFAAPTHAQNQAAHTGLATAAAPAFDVISIKPAKPGATGTDLDFDNATYTARNATLSKIMQDTYGVPAPRILGIPPALEKAAFDIQAKVDPAVYARIQALGNDQRTDEIQKLIQQLLADRFKLVLHTDPRTPCLRSGHCQRRPQTSAHCKTR